MSERIVKEQISAFLAANQKAMVEDLAHLVEVPSIARVGADGLPYGKEVYEAMLRAEAIAKRMGFTTKIVDDAVLLVESGSKPVQVCLMAHLDVVDAGEGWDTPPYQLIEQEDRYVGRGSTDNKSGAVAALYALKLVEELRGDLPYGAQLWLGSAEEIGSPDLKHYLKNHTMPPYVVTPDSMERLCTGESAKYRPDFFGAWEESDASPRVLWLQGGKVRNAIPDHAEACVEGLTAREVQELAQAVGGETEVTFTLRDTAEGLLICADGRGAHIGLAEQGRNAQTAIIALLSRLPLAQCGANDAIRALARLFPHGDMTGAAMGLTVRDEVMGTSRTNFTTCTLNAAGMKGQFDSRGPTNATPENYANIIAAALRAAGFTVEESEMDAAHYVPETAPIVKTMKKLSARVCGEEPECQFSFGGTYAHYIDGAVAFTAANPDVISAGPPLQWPVSTHLL